jgi:hypothetical protein
MTETFDVAEFSDKSLGVWSYFMKKFSSKQDNKKVEFLDNLKKAQDELNVAVNNYEFADEPELVDYYTYNIKAAQTKYEYLLKKAKEQGM